MNDNDLKKHLSALAPPAPGEAARESARHAALAALADSAVPATPAAPASDVGGFGHTVATAGRRRSRPHGIRALFPAVAAFAAALAAALAILAVFFWRPTAGEGPVVTGVRSDSGDAATPLPADDAREMLAQVATLFPGQLNAVIERNGSVQIDVSAPPPPSPSICGSAASVSTSVSTSTFVSASASIAAAPTAAPLADSQPLVVQLRRGAERLRVLSYSGRRVCLDLDGSRVCFDVLATADGGVLLAGTDFLWSPAHPVRVAGYEIRARSLTTTTISASLL